MLPASLTVEALKRRIDKQLSGDDLLLAAYLEGAFRQAQAPAPLGCGRLLSPDPPEDSEEPVVRESTIRGRHVLIADAREISKVEVDDAEVTGYRSISRDGVVVRLEIPRDHPCWWSWDSDWGFGRSPWRGRTRTVKVTGRFGFTEIPFELREAIYTLAARMFYEREAQFADTVAVGEGAAAQIYYRQLPPRARLAFESFALPAGIAGLA